MGFWGVLLCLMLLLRHFSDAVSECNCRAKASDSRGCHLEHSPWSCRVLRSALKESSDQSVADTAADEGAVLLGCPWYHWAAEGWCLRLSKGAGLVLVLGWEDCLWVQRRFPPNGVFLVRWGTVHADLLKMGLVEELAHVQLNGFIMGCKNWNLLMCSF